MAKSIEEERKKPSATTVNKTGSEKRKLTRVKSQGRFVGEDLSLKFQGNTNNSRSGKKKSGTLGAFRSKKSQNNPVSLNSRADVDSHTNPNSKTKTRKTTPSSSSINLVMKRLGRVGSKRVKNSQRHRDESEELQVFTCNEVEPARKMADKWKMKSSRKF